MENGNKNTEFVNKVFTEFIDSDLIDVLLKKWNLIIEKDKKSFVIKLYPKIIN